MDLNTLVFPAPGVTWNYNDFLGELLWIPAKKAEVDQETFNRRIVELSEKVLLVLLRVQSKVHIST